MKATLRLCFTAVAAVLTLALICAAQEHTMPREQAVVEALDENKAPGGIMPNMVAHRVTSLRRRRLILAAEIAVAAILILLMFCLIRKKVSICRFFTAGSRSVIGVTEGQFRAELVQDFLLFSHTTTKEGVTWELCAVG